jgi:hypothetical protein
MVAGAVAIAHRLSAAGQAMESERMETPFPEVCRCVESERDSMSIGTSSPFVARSRASRQGVQHHMNAKVTLVAVNRHSLPLVSLAHLPALCFFSEKARRVAGLVAPNTANLAKPCPLLEPPDRLIKMIAEEVIGGDKMYPLQKPDRKWDTTSKIEECEHKAYYDTETQLDRHSFATSC